MFTAQTAKNLIFAGVCNMIVVANASHLMATAAVQILWLVAFGIQLSVNWIAIHSDAD